MQSIPDRGWQRREQLENEFDCKSVFAQSENFFFFAAPTIEIVVKKLLLRVVHTDRLTVGDITLIEGH